MGSRDVRVPRPEAEGDDLVRVGLARDRVRARPLRGASAGEAGDGEVEAVPEELDGARLAVEAPGELLGDLIHPRPARGGNACT